MPDILFDSFLQKLKKLRPEVLTERIQKAYKIAYEAHKDQKRVSGEPYVTHPIEVATILLNINADEPTFIAALLHDVVEDTSVTLEDIKREFDSEIASLVEGLTKISKVESIGLDSQMGNIRKMFLAMSRDIRVIYVKLADRLHNMQTIGIFREEKQKRIAEETLYIYAPIATRLGVYYFKDHLEELSFKVLYPQEYTDISKQLKVYNKNEEKIGETAVNDLKKHLKDESVYFHTITWREKQRYSIFRKLLKNKEKDIHNIYDIFAVRIVTNTVENCYRILGVIHKYWKPLPNRFKDYIAVPKSNGYQSLHTTVFGLGKSGKTIRPVEIQIRTEKMNEDSERGNAAHWSYKEGLIDTANKQWIQALISLANEMEQSSGEFYTKITNDVLNYRIFIITPKGDIRDLPKGSTPIDFAYSIHSDIGNHITSAKVNGKVVPLNEELHNGDIVEIKTDKKRTPNPAWVNIVKTSHAKACIKQWLKQQSQENILKLGREEVNKLLKKVGKEPLDKEYSVLKNYRGQELSVRKREDIIMQVGEGSVKASEIIKNILQGAARPGYIQTASSEVAPEGQNEMKEILVLGEKSFETKVASCCNPQHQDRITGYITRGGYVSIHKISCPFVEKNADDRFVECHWAGEELPFEVEFHLGMKNILGVTASILQFFAEQDLNMLNMDVRTNKARNTAEGKILTETYDIDKISFIADNLKNFDGITSVDYIVKK